MRYILLQFTENVISHQAEGNLFQVGWNTESSTNRVFCISTINTVVDLGNYCHTLKCSSPYHVLVFIERRVLNTAIYKTYINLKDISY